MRPQAGRGKARRPPSGGPGTGIEESWDRYTDDNNDIAHLLNSATHYSPNSYAMVYSTTRKSLVAGNGGGLCLRSDINDTEQSTYRADSRSLIDLSGGGVIVLTQEVRISAGGSMGSDGSKWIEIRDFPWDPPGDGGSANNRFQFGCRPTGWEFVAGSNPGQTVNRTAGGTGMITFDDINDGNWHTCKYVIKQNTTSSYFYTGGFNASATETYNGTSSRDGFVLMFVDGNLALKYHQETAQAVGSGALTGGNTCYQGDVDFIPGLSDSNSADLSAVRLNILTDVVNNGPSNVGFVAYTDDRDLTRLWVME
jgi:hypothetical protein